MIELLSCSGLQETLYHADRWAESHRPFIRNRQTVSSEMHGPVKRNMHQTSTQNFEPQNSVRNGGVILFIWTCVTQDSSGARSCLSAMLIKYNSNETWRACWLRRTGLAIVLRLQGFSALRPWYIAVFSMKQGVQIASFSLFWSAFFSVLNRVFHLLWKIIPQKPLQIKEKSYATEPCFMEHVRIA